MRGLKELGFESYDEYLLSPHWREFKRQYDEAGRSKECKVCGTDIEVQLHHTTYKRLGREDMSDVMPLCHTHHGQVHVWLTKRNKHIELTYAAVAALRRGEDPEGPIPAPKKSPFLFGSKLPRIKGVSNPAIGKTYRAYYRVRNASLLRLERLKQEIPDHEMWSGWIEEFKRKSLEELELLEVEALGAMLSSGSQTRS